MKPLYPVKAFSVNPLIKCKHPFANCCTSSINHMLGYTIQAINQSYINQINHILHDQIKPFQKHLIFLNDFKVLTFHPESYSYTRYTIKSIPSKAFPPTKDDFLPEIR